MKRPHPSKSTRLLAGALAAAASFAPAPAEACGACGCFVPYGVRPQNLLDDVPRNARVLIALKGLDAAGQPTTIDADDIRWSDADGGAVDFDLVPADGTGDEVWLVPTEDLAAETEYRIEVIEPNGASTTLFTTGTATDETPPEASAPTAEASESSPACGAFSGARLVWDEINDAGSAIEYDPVVRLEVERGEDAVVLFTNASQLFPGRGVELASPGNDESERCWGQLALPFGNAGDTLTVTATIYDAAGNALELDPVEATLGESPGATCPDGGASDDGSGDDGSAERGGGNCAVGPTGAGALGPGWLVMLAAGLVSVGSRVRRSFPARTHHGRSSS